jgi:CRP-like cAMP-binding protein
MIIPSELQIVQKKIMSFGTNPTQKEISLLLPYLDRKFFKKGEIILNAGDICTEAYFIIRGIVRSFQKMPNGNEKTYTIACDNNLFSEHSSFMSQSPSTDYLEALEDTEVIAFSYKDLMYLYQKYHAWETIGRKISDINFIVVQKRLRSMMNDDAAKRYHRFLESYQNYLDRIPQ